MTDLIKHHVVNGTYYTNNFTDTPVTVTTLNGTQIELKGNTNGTLFNVGNATIIKPDILTNEGVIHIIDQVLQPPPSNDSSTISPSSSASTPSATSEAPPPPANSTTSAAGFLLTPSATVGLLLCLCSGLLSLM
ncbi:hypothetical protein BC941DRAFT_417673 [Chlamydoabsidia padenii]|nr:hypothetical protein BC941DRAFT_417673 [Chlamydoabsidia padenii]